MKNIVKKFDNEIFDALAYNEQEVRGLMDAQAEDVYKAMYDGDDPATVAGMLKLAALAMVQWMNETENVGYRFAFTMDYILNKEEETKL